MSEYEVLLPNSDLERRKEYWEIGKGLQAADGLRTSEYLEKIIAETLTGTYDTQKAAEKITQYYRTNGNVAADCRTDEADISAARIAACLETNDFKFSPVMLKSIHRRLFSDASDSIGLGKWAGVFRTNNLGKAERVLHGQSMKYAAWEDISDMLTYEFEEERKKVYKLPFDDQQIDSIIKFMSGIWEIHPFAEGNTRTTSTFIIKYLQSLGIEINNDPFKNNASWLRDALVRANHTDAQRGIVPDKSYLKMFFENILLDAGHDLASFDLVAEVKHESDHER